MNSSFSPSPKPASWLAHPVIRIAIPVALQNLLGSLVQLIDNFMLSRLSIISVSAIGMANQAFLIVLVTIFGITSGVGVFISQYLGQENWFAIKKCFATMLVVTSGVGVLAGISVVSFAPYIIGFFTDNQEIIALGSQYLRIVGFAYPLMSISMTFYLGLRSAERAEIGLYVLGLSIFFNVLGNYALIYGNFGMPALGVQGAAVATLAAYCVQFFFVIFLIYRDPNNPAHITLKHFLALDKKFLKQLLPITLPVVTNDFMFVLGFIVMNKAIAHSAQELYGIYEIVNSIYSTSFVLFLGVGVAASVQIGKALGAKDYAASVTYAKKYTLYPILLSLLYSISLVFLTVPLSWLFFPDTEYHALFRQFLYILACLIPFSSFTFIGILGVLRAGGDTKFALLIEVSSIWLFSVPLSYFLSYGLESPSPWVYVGTRLCDILAALFVAHRIFSKKWLQTLV